MLTMQPLSDHLASATQRNSAVLQRLMVRLQGKKPTRPPEKNIYDAVGRVHTRAQEL